MSSNVVRLSERAPAPVEDYLGPAEAVRVAGGEIHVELPSGATARAELAIAFPYEPAVGDVLLVIGRGEAYYVIGVLRGAGRSVLAFPGDVAVHAGGELQLSGERGVRIDGAEVEIKAGKLRTIADSVLSRFTSVYERVTEMLSVHAGQQHTLVEDASYTQARTAAIVTEGTVTLNGREIHLG